MDELKQLRVLLEGIKRDNTEPDKVWLEASNALEVLYLLDRRAAPENKPLTLDQLRKMNEERVWTQFRGLGMYGLVAHHSDPDGDDGDDVYITNNLGGRSTFEEILGQGGTIYAHKPGQEEK